MQKIIDFVRRRTIPVFIGVVVLLLIISAVLKALSPPVIPVPQSTKYTQTNFYGQKTTFKNIKYSGIQSQLPAQMSVNSQKPLTLTIDDVLAQIVKNYNLKPLTGVENIWSGQNYSMTKTDVTGAYTLTNDNPESLTGKVINIDQSISTAEKFIAEYFPNVQVTAVKDKAVYYQSGIEPVEIDAAKADSLYLPFTYQIDGYPVYFQSNASYPFDFIIDANQNLQRTDFSPFFIQLFQVQKQNTISVAQAIRNINEGQASLINLDLDAGAVNDISQIQSGDLKSHTVEYRVDEKSGLVYPFYRFTGSVVNSDNQTFTVEIITPAIQTTGQK